MKFRALTKVAFIGIVVSLVLSGCEMPQTEDKLKKPIPAVWAIFSPDQPIEITLTKVEPFGQEFLPDSAFIHNATLLLSGGDEEITFEEKSIVTEWGTRWVYVPSDTSFRVQPGVTYTLTGSTNSGDFMETFTVPNRPQFSIFPDTAVFDNVVPAAFGIVISPDEEVYEYEIEFENIGTSREFLPDSIIMQDCIELRWLTAHLPDTIGIPWCSFDYATTYEVNVIAREKHLYDFLDYYYYYDDGEDEYYSSPGGDGYIGVIGAYCVSKDTVVVELGH